MSKTEFIRARVEPDLKQMAEHILDELGITPTQAIRMLYKRIVRDQEWPLELKIPNAKTRHAMEETDKGISLIDSKDINDLFKKLGI